MASPPHTVFPFQNACNNYNHCCCWSAGWAPWGRDSVFFSTVLVTGHVTVPGAKWSAEFSLGIFLSEGLRHRSDLELALGHTAGAGGRVQTQVCVTPESSFISLHCLLPSVGELGQGEFYIASRKQTILRILCILFGPLNIIIQNYLLIAHLGPFLPHFFYTFIILTHTVWWWFFFFNIYLSVFPTGLRSSWEQEICLLHLFIYSTWHSASI